MKAVSPSDKDLVFRPQGNTVAVETAFPKRVLAHICCGPCSIYPLKVMLEGRTEVTGFFFNPNIHPRSEFKKRLEAAKTLAKYLSLNLLCAEDYAPSGFIKGARAASGLSRVKGYPEKDKRCLYCYASRLEETAKTAARLGFDAFSSSLLYSRYQRHDVIKAIGTALADKYGVSFFYMDFRTGWQEGINESRAMGLYRQKYCGCIYSKLEREREKKNKAARSPFDRWN